MKETILQSTLRELQSILANPRIWLVFGAVVVLFTSVGPFGTLEGLALPARLGYWLIVQAFAWMLALVFVAFFDAALAGWIGHVLPRMLVGAALAVLPMALMLLLVNAAFRGAPISLAEYASDAATALPIALVMCLLSWMALDGTKTADDLAPAPDAVTARESSDEPEAPAGRSQPPRPALLDRLATGKRGALVRLEVQDHYVLVVTARGREMVLMRLADAIREAAPVDGLQVHRSHWVARDGVAGVIREPGRNGRTLIRTTDGADVPVSRGNMADVKAWLG